MYIGTLILLSEWAHIWLSAYSVVVSYSVQYAYSVVSGKGVSTIEMVSTHICYVMRNRRMNLCGRICA